MIKFRKWNSRYLRVKLLLKIDLKVNKGQILKEIRLEEQKSLKVVKDVHLISKLPLSIEGYTTTKIFF